MNGQRPSSSRLKEGFDEISLDSSWPPLSARESTINDSGNTLETFDSSESDDIESNQIDQASHDDIPREAGQGQNDVPQTRGRNVSLGEVPALAAFRKFSNSSSAADAILGTSTQTSPSYTPMLSPVDDNLYDIIDTNLLSSLPLDSNNQLSERLSAKPGRSDLMDDKKGLIHGLQKAISQDVMVRLDVAMDELTKQLDRFQQHSKDLEDLGTRAESVMTSYKNESTTAEQDIQDQLDKFSNLQESFSAIESLTSRINTAKTTVGEYRQRLRNVQDQIQEYQSTKTELKRRWKIRKRAIFGMAMIIASLSMFYQIFKDSRNTPLYYDDIIQL